MDTATETSPQERDAINKALYLELVELAQPHVEASNGTLGILDYDPKAYDAQQYDSYVEPGQVSPIEVLDLIGITVLEGFAGKNAVRGFAEISEDLMDKERRYAVRETVRGGKSLYIATSHSHLIDPAIGLAAVINPLHREKDEHDDFQTGIIINKMLAVLKYRVGKQWMPCMQVLQMLCDRSYLSYPQSETFRNSDAAKVLPDGHIQAHNGNIKSEIAAWLAAGSVILGVAPTGSTHKEKVHRWSERPKIVLPEVTKGTGEMQAHENIRVLSLIMSIDTGEQFIEAASEGLYRVKRWPGTHRITRDMAKAFNARDEARDESASHAYQVRRGFRDLPILRRRYVTLERPEVSIRPVDQA